MNYQTARPLPFAEIGTPVDNVGGGIQIKSNLRGELILLGGENTLLRTGWIEEVKPRKYWLLVDENNEAISTSKFAPIHNPHPDKYDCFQVEEII